MTKKILWLVTAIEDIGGGERLLFEGLKYYKKNNINVKVVTWRYNEKAFFDEKYKFDNIEVLQSKKIDRKNIFKMAFNRAKTILDLYKIAKIYQPDLILCQSEYDAILAGFLAKLLYKPYTVLIFGQTYQLPWDMMKYSYFFKKHLKEIVDSCQGYKDSIPLNSPVMPWLDRVILEILSILRIYFIRNATNTYTLSSQVQWEIDKIYGIKPKLLRAGFSDVTFEERKKISVTKQKSNKLKFVMLSRLVKKKRIDLAIEAFAKLNIDAELMIMGGGEEFEKLKILINKLNLNDKIILTGRVSDTELEYNLANSDVFINMDIGDFDITVVEAMSFGLYILVSTDFVIDEDFKAYRSIESVLPNSQQLANIINTKFETFKTLKPNFDMLKLLTWENYFNKIIEDNQ